MAFRGKWIPCALVLFFAGTAFGAEWYQSYEKGYKAVEKGKCADGVPLLKEALAKNPKADLKARPYGMITWEYIPQYYLAKCALESGDFAAAKTYADAALQGDIYSSSKATEFRQIQKALDEKLGTSKKPPVNNTTPPNQNTTKPTTNTTNPPPANPTADRQAIISRVLNEAQMSYAAGNFDAANDAVDRVLVLDRTNAEALRLRSQIAQKQAAAQATQQKQQRIAEARRAISRADYASAENIALELKSDYPSDRAVLSLAEEIEKTKSEKMKTMQTDESKKFMERQVISAFYTGKYNAVIEIADQAVTQYPDSWRLLFYQGCAYAALSILESSNQDQRLTRARESFRKAKTVAGGDITQPPQISPKIWDVYRSS